MRRLAALSVVLALGCATREACPPGDLTLPPQTPAFVVVRSDHSSSALALLAADGTVLTPDLIDSGTRSANLVTALSGDVVVPSTPLGSGTIVWVERLYVDLVTFLDDAGSVTQVDARGESVDAPHTGFSANPQDALLLPDGRVLVSRLRPNPDPGAPELQRGNDLVVVEAGAVTERVALDADGTIEACTSADCTAYAYPAVLLPLRAGDTRAVLVVLERLPNDFQRGAGTGAVVAVDSTTLEVSAPLELPPLQNCQFASVDPLDPSRAYVACTALLARDAEARRPNAGVAEITLSPDGTLAVTAMVQTPAGVPVLGGAVLALGQRRILGVASDSHAGDAPLPDHLLEVDVETGAARDVYQTRMGFMLHPGALAGTLALIPDEESSAILRIDVSGPATLRDTIAIEDCTGLPPIQIAPLEF